MRIPFIIASIASLFVGAFFLIFGQQSTVWLLQTASSVLATMMVFLIVFGWAIAFVIRAALEVWPESVTASPPKRPTPSMKSEPGDGASIPKPESLRSRYSISTAVTTVQSKLQRLRKSLCSRDWIVISVSVASVVCLAGAAQMVMWNHHDSIAKGRIEHADAKLNGAVADAQNWVKFGHEQLGERIESSLTEALANEDVTDRNLANETLQKVKNRRAEIRAEWIRADGLRAIDNGDLQKACDLFKEYIALPLAPKKDEVERFLSEADLAKSESAAFELLVAMSPEEFIEFRAKGRINEKQIQHPILQSIHVKTLHAATGKAVARRDELQAAAEQARFQAHLQAHRDEAARAEVARAAMQERQRKEDADRKQREEDAILNAISAFLNATPSERFKHVVGGENLREKITEYYQKNGNGRIGGELSVLKRTPITADTVLIDVEINSMLSVDKRTLHVRRVAGKWLVDWPATVGLNVPSFAALKATPPREFVVIRAIAELDDYYNFRYANAKSSHYSIRLTGLQDGRFYGYVSRNSDPGRQLIKLLEDGREHRVTVSIGWQRSGSDSADHVEIVGFGGEHWFID